MYLKLSLLLLLAGVLHKGTALKCYNCDSQTMPSCGDPMNPDEAWHMDCGYSSKAIPELLHEFYPGLRSANEATFGDGACFKTVQTKDNKTTILRSCSMFGEATCELFGGAVHGQGGTMDFCGICADELCNSAPGLNILLSLVLTAPFMLLLKSF